MALKTIRPINMPPALARLALTDAQLTAFWFIARGRTSESGLRYAGVRLATLRALERHGLISRTYDEEHDLVSWTPTVTGNVAVAWWEEHQTVVPR